MSGQSRGGLHMSRTPSPLGGPVHGRPRQLPRRRHRPCSRPCLSHRRWRCPPCHVRRCPCHQRRLCLPPPNGGPGARARQSAGRAPRAQPRVLRPAGARRQALRPRQRAAHAARNGGSVRAATPPPGGGPPARRPSGDGDGDATRARRRVAPWRRRGGLCARCQRRRARMRKQARRPRPPRKRGGLLAEQPRDGLARNEASPSPRWILAAQRRPEDAPRPQRCPLAPDGSQLKRTGKSQARTTPANRKRPLTGARAL
jgi:hypothetical protein